MSNLKSRLLAVSVLAALGASAYTVAASNTSPAASRARALLDANRARVAAADGDAFVVRDVVVDRNGTEHARFTRTYLGLPVIGGDFVLHSRNGVVRGVSKTFAGTARPNIAARLGADQAIVEAGAHFGTGFVGTPTASKVIYARGRVPTLAWDVAFSGMKADQTPTNMHYIVDANSGRVLDRWDTVHTAKPGSGSTGCTSTTNATGTGRSLFSGSVSIATVNCSGSYQMKDNTRGGGYTTDLGGRTSGTGTMFTDADNTWGSGTTADRATVGVDAHYGVATTWDYYKNVHGRNGIANDGKGALSRVHYGRNYVNAFWSDSCFCMTFGDGDGTNYYPLVNIDVAGHEMSHGVTSRSANLTYSGESGGLNEASSDIMGTMVEFYANNANDPGDYLIGEKLYIKYPNGNRALRYMYNPSLDGSSPNCYTSTIGSLDVHYSSGVANHFFYLLAEGSGAKSFNGVDHTSPTCNGSSVAGIGRDAAQKIWYRGLTVYMTSNTNYAGARQATLNAAADLYGANSSQYNAVAAAWSAVGVN